MSDNWGRKMLAHLFQLQDDAQKRLAAERLALSTSKRAAMRKANAKRCQQRESRRINRRRA